MCSRPPLATSLSLNVLFVDDISISVDPTGREETSLCYLVALCHPQSHTHCYLCLVLNFILMDAYSHNRCRWLFLFMLTLLDTEVSF